MCEPIPWTSVARTRLQAQPQTSKGKANASVWSEGRDASATWWPPDDTEAIIIEESVTYVQGQRNEAPGLAWSRFQKRVQLVTRTAAVPQIEHVRQLGLTGLGQRAGAAPTPLAAPGISAQQVCGSWCPRRTWPTREPRPFPVSGTLRCPHLLGSSGH